MHNTRNLDLIHVQSLVCSVTMSPDNGIEIIGRATLIRGLATATAWLEANHS